MDTIKLDSYITSIYTKIPELKEYPFPWFITSQTSQIVALMIRTLPSTEYKVENNVAVHNTAVVESNVQIKGPCIIGPNCFVGANAYLRDGVYLGENVKIGPSSEVKASIIGDGSALAHLNYVGNSILGQNINMEAGAVIANHWNEREDKMISVLIDRLTIKTGVEKFGALVGDNCKIGANAVLSPGTILKPKTIVKRLELVDQTTAVKDWPSSEQYSNSLL